jgi:hypothetical protein
MRATVFAEGDVPAEHGVNASATWQRRMEEGATNVY